jgi:hypothetical protein
MNNMMKKAVELAEQDEEAGNTAGREVEGTALETGTLIEKESVEITEHKLSKEDLAALLKVDFAQGLSEEEAAKRLLENGPNSLTPPPVTPLWVKFAQHLFGGFA